MLSLCSAIPSLAFAAVSGMHCMGRAPAIEHKSCMIRLGVQDPEHGACPFSSVALLMSDADVTADLEEIIDNSVHFLPERRAKQVIKDSSHMVKGLMGLRPLIAVTTFAFPNYLDAQDAIVMDEMTKEIGLHFLTHP